MTERHAATVTRLYEIPVLTLDGQSTTLAEYSGKVLLIVNVASQCGFTPQYEGLEKLYRKYVSRGLVVLGFPCNQFGAQEPGEAAEIRNFCDTRYGVTFPLFQKIDVNGGNAHPLYRLLKQSASGVLQTEAIKWNFTKFLVDRQGEVVERFAPATKPIEIETRIVDLL